MTTERIDTDEGVMYADEDTHRVAVQWQEARDFDLQWLDNWIERQCPPAKREEMLYLREVAIESELIGNSVAVSFALLYFMAATRLDTVTTVLMPRAVRDVATQAGRRLGGKSKPAKLPPAEVLRAEIEQLQAARGTTAAEAKGILRKRYDASAQAINAKLKKS